MPGKFLQGIEHQESVKNYSGLTDWELALIESIPEPMVDVYGPSGIETKRLAEVDPDCEIVRLFQRQKEARERIEKSSEIRKQLLENTE